MIDLNERVFVVVSPLLQMRRHLGLVTLVVFSGKLLAVAS